MNSIEEKISELSFQIAQFNFEKRKLKSCMMKQFKS